MFELELKAKIEDRFIIKNKLKNLGCKWSGAKIQIDTIYKRNSTQDSSEIPVFRIRKCNDKIILSLKILEEDINTAKELELEISDSKVMSDILRVLGFRPIVEVIKRRETTTYKGFNICLDDVERLGTFVEIEKLSESIENKESIYQKINLILSELGVEKQDIVLEKYYQMILNSCR